MRVGEGTEEGEGRRKEWQGKGPGREGSEEGRESGTEEGLKWEGEEMPKRGKSD